MNIRELVPGHKDDQEVIEGLKKLSFEEMKPIVSDLLEWLQDINWPIARPVAEVLRPFADQLVPDIIKILRTNDGIWKLWVLVALGRNTQNHALLKEIERIAKYPTKDELEEGVHQEAMDILNNAFNPERQ
ncbi:hypothetical protein HNQ91_001681 [Filimonas zeae]|uniref:DUF5071 domain-containing protein n=1 Tax=Filimonas zeae TaxID=1737353 RepID=A0A917IY92_9BACT|nr:DUF5071 domain-containing protein [Filimonas zeae]MDR6338630.1 hypothetical protein [Filimonas zeae]GGH67316.1 hypothetical protein GCM10011379_22460 [Filimonas zeae]